MDANTLAEMESNFGTDFSNVRIHTDSEAQHMSQEVGAQAFTHGSDIYFNEGKYNPDSKEGKHLLAHELTHTIQQNAVSTKNTENDSGHAHSQQKIHTKSKKAKATLFQESMKRLKSVHPGIYKLLSKSRLNGGFIEVARKTGSNHVLVTRLRLQDSGVKKPMLAKYEHSAWKTNNKKKPPVTYFDSTIYINAAVHTDSTSPATILNYSKSLFHEGIHFLLAQQRFIKRLGFKGHKPDALKVGYDKYRDLVLKDSESRRLISLLVAKLRKDKNLTVKKSKLEIAAYEILSTLIEEKFTFDQELKKYSVYTNNAQIASKYLILRLSQMNAKLTRGILIPLYLSAKKMLDNLDKSLTKKATKKKKP